MKSWERRRPRTRIRLQVVYNRVSNVQYTAQTEVGMNGVDQLYRNLQIHLDKQTVGFPETKSGSDIALLKELFTPEQAEVVMLLTYRFESLEQIKERAKSKSAAEIERLLDETAAKGIIGRREKEGQKQYKTIPYVVGMLEAMALHATPGFIAAHLQYSAEGLFWKDFINTKIPQVRTIPVQKSITPKHQVGNYDEIRKIIETTIDPIAVIECVCRKGAEKSGAPCKRTSRKETCMAFRHMARNIIQRGTIGRQISKEEALEILRQNEDDGLVLQPSNSQTPDFICSCCGCCCGLLKLHKYIPNPVDHWATNFFAEVDLELCLGCGLCEERCQASALKMNQASQVMTVDLTRCLGCGLCIEACPEQALELKKKPTETVPPPTMDDTIEVIMSNK
jgi:Na+-translocating ferredoxin:NAD+ oxidoreductase subunit B